MHYLIDFDTRSVQCKSADREPLEEYIQDNSLEMAVYIASEASDIEMEMSLDEINELYVNLAHGSEDRKFKRFESEEDGSEAVYGYLEDNADDYPKYTKALGKRLLKAGNTDTEDKPAPAAKVNKRDTPEARAKAEEKRLPYNRFKLKGDEHVIVVDKHCKKGSIAYTIITAIEDAMCSTVDEIVEYVIANHTMARSGKTPDRKYALHNIVYFVKQGRLEIDEL